MLKKLFLCISLMLVSAPTISMELSPLEKCKIAAKNIVKDYNEWKQTYPQFSTAPMDAAVGRIGKVINEDNPEIIKAKLEDFSRKIDNRLNNKEQSQEVLLAFGTLQKLFKEQMESCQSALVTYIEQPQKEAAFFGLQLNKITPYPPENKFITCYNITYKNKEGEPGYKKFYKLSGEAQVCDDDGFLTLVFLARIFQEYAALEFKKSSMPEDHFYNEFSKKNVLQEQIIKNLISLTISRLPTKLNEYTQKNGGEYANASKELLAATKKYNQKFDHFPLPHLTYEIFFDCFGNFLSKHLNLFAFSTKNNLIFENLGFENLLLSDYKLSTLAKDPTIKDPISMTGSFDMVLENYSSDLKSKNYTNILNEKKSILESREILKILKTKDPNKYFILQESSDPTNLKDNYHLIQVSPEETDLQNIVREFYIDRFDLDRGGGITFTTHNHGLFYINLINIPSYTQDYRKNRKPLENVNMNESEYVREWLRQWESVQ